MITYYRMCPTCLAHWMYEPALTSYIIPGIILYLVCVLGVHLSLEAFIGIPGIRNRQSFLLESSVGRALYVLPHSSVINTVHDQQHLRMRGGQGQQAGGYEYAFSPRRLPMTPRKWGRRSGH